MLLFIYTPHKYLFYTSGAVIQDNAHVNYYVEGQNAQHAPSHLSLSLKVTNPVGVTKHVDGYNVNIELIELLKSIKRLTFHWTVLLNVQPN